MIIDDEGVSFKPTNPVVIVGRHSMQLLVMHYPIILLVSTIVKTIYK